MKKERMETGSKRRQSKDVLEDPDPMMQALFQNVVSLEEILLAVRTNVSNLVKATNFLCLNMNTLAANVSSFCSPDEALSKDTSKYFEKIGLITGNGSGSARQSFLNQVEMKVLEPLNVNLKVLSDIKQRVFEREALRKSQQTKILPKLPIPFGRKQDKDDAKSKHVDLDKITKDLFEELSALFQYRFDFVRAPYQALKKFQFIFFHQCSTILQDVTQVPAPRPASSVEPPKAPPPKQAKSATEMLRESPSLQDSKKFQEEQANRRKSLRAELSKRSDSVKKMIARRLDSDKPAMKEEEVVVAVPVDTGFNPDADRPAAGTAYLRLGKAKGNDAVGTSLMKKKESENSQVEVGIDDTRVTSFQGACDIAPIKIKIKSRKASDKSKRTETSHGSDEIRMAPPPGNGHIAVLPPPASSLSSSSSTGGEIRMPPPPGYQSKPQAKLKKKKKSKHSTSSEDASVKSSGEIVMHPPFDKQSHTGEIVMQPPTESHADTGEIVMQPPTESHSDTGEIVMQPPTESHSDTGEIVMQPPTESHSDTGEIVMHPPFEKQTHSGEIVMQPPTESHSDTGEIVMQPPTESHSATGDIAMHPPFDNQSHTDEIVMEPPTESHSTPNSHSDNDEIAIHPPTGSHFDTDEIIMHPPTKSDTDTGEIAIDPPSEKQSETGEIVMDAPPTERRSTPGSHSEPGEVAIESPLEMDSGEIVMQPPSSPPVQEFVDGNAVNGEIAMPPPFKEETTNEDIPSPPTSSPPPLPEESSLEHQQVSLDEDEDDFSDFVSSI